MPKTYTIHSSRTGDTRTYSTSGDATKAWQDANADNLPALIVTYEDGSARIAGHTTTTSGLDGAPIYGKSPQTPTL